MSFLQRRLKLLIGIGIILLTLSAYFPAIKGAYIWDDDNYITNNHTLKTVQGLKDIWLKPSAIPQYYPLVHTTFWIEYRLWKLNPMGYHIVNVLLHIATAILTWIVLKQLGTRNAWIIACAFAIHPVHVESVAWVTERKNVLSAFFYLLSLIAFIRFIDQNTINMPDKRRNYRFYFISLFFYLCALLSKTVTCTLPIVILIILWWRVNFPGKQSIAYLTPFLVIGAILGMVTIYLEKYHVGAVGNDWDISFLGRCTIAGRALWFYFGKVLWPEGLTFIYPRWEITTFFWQDGLYLIGFLIIYLVLFFNRRRLGKGPFAALTIFVVTLFPALSFFNVYPMRYSFVADHFQYLASIPILCFIISSFSMVTPIIETILRQFRDSLRLFRLLQMGIFACVIGVLSFMTWERCHVFQNAETLWLDTIAKNPKAWMAHNNLGLIYARKNRSQEAIYHYNKAIGLRPNHTSAYNNAAMEWEKLGNYSQAKTYFAKALHLEPNNSYTIK